MNVVLNNGKLVISFLYDPALVAWVKGLEGRKWIPSDKTWSALLCVENIDMLREKGFSVSQDVATWYDRAGAVEVEPEIELDVPGLKGKLFPFQKKGVAFLESRQGRGLIADEMGLGKTVQTLAWLQLHPEVRPAIMVVPSSVKLNWQREAERWMNGPTPQVLSGRTGISRDISEMKINMIPPASLIVIINYDILSNQKEKYWVCSNCGWEMDAVAKGCSGCTTIPREIVFQKREVKDSGWIDRLRDMHFKAVVIDECHYIKGKTARTKAVRKLCRGVPHIIALSGTPIVNRPIEIYNTLSLLQRDLFPNWWNYARRYCNLKHSRYGWDYTGSSNTQELHDRLIKTVMIRRLKKEVLPELPDKVRTVIPLELDNRAEYDDAEEDFIGWLKGFDSEKAQRASNAEALARIEGLKQLTIAGKLEGCRKWVEDFLASGEKLVLFCTHRKTVEYFEHCISLPIATITSRKVVKERDASSVTYYGGQSDASRQYAIDLFQKSPMCKIIICNIKAGGVGINLQAASNVAFVELGWTPGEHDQAEDRVHRIGQEASSVNAWYLLAADTIEEEIAALLDKKRKVLSQVLDGKDVDDESMLGELLDKYKKEK